MVPFMTYILEDRSSCFPTVSETQCSHATRTSCLALVQQELERRGFQVKWCCVSGRDIGAPVQYSTNFFAHFTTLFCFLRCLLDYVWVWFANVCQTSQKRVFFLATRGGFNFVKACTCETVYPFGF